MFQFRMSDSDWSEQSNGKVEFSTVSASKFWHCNIRDMPAGFCEFKDTNQ